MVFCGIKLTHDGAVAVIDGDTLVFCTEVEKLNNNPRYSQIEDTSVVSGILRDEGVSLDSIDHIAVDGWGGYRSDELALQPRLTLGPEHNLLAVEEDGMAHSLPVSLYCERHMREDVLAGMSFEGFPVARRRLRYESYLHVAGHVLGSYCTSPFSREGESSFILVWDGGMYPRLYYFDALAKRVENLGPLFLLIGNVYTIFAQHFDPFSNGRSFAKDDLSIAGKVMAYIALGELRKEWFEEFDEICKAEFSSPMGFANVLARTFKERLKGRDFRHQDILRTFHDYLEQLIVGKLAKKVSRVRHSCRNLCIAGGCGLNIKWNQAIRSSGLMERVYIPPFPNDSGSAIGMACCAMSAATGNFGLNWNVYSGPQVKVSYGHPDWNENPCSIKELAELLHETQEPVVFLNGRAELGPRALGGRSILASPARAGTTELLNRVKKREFYRPISPVCTEDRAGKIFDPGCADPYMLFDHKVREHWRARIPAVCHIDHTARLQTVNRSQNALLHDLLVEFEKVSSIPVLCNTSANFNGKGFFPDVASAMAWGRVRFIWSNGVLFRKSE